MEGRREGEGVERAAVMARIQGKLWWSGRQAGAGTQASGGACNMGEEVSGWS